VEKISSTSESLSNNNPFSGLTLQGKVIHTFYKGVQTVSDSEVLELGETNA